MAFKRKIRKHILAQAGYKCQACGCDIKEVLEAAHIVKQADNPDATEAITGICLCANCHTLYDKTGKLEFKKDENEDPEITRWRETGEWPSWADKFDKEVKDDKEGFEI